MNFQEFRSNATTKPVNGRVRVKKEEDYESDSQETETNTNAMTKPVNCRVRIKKEEDYESDSQETEMNTEDTALSNDDRSSQLIAELRTFRGAYNDIFFSTTKIKRIGGCKRTRTKVYC